MFDSCFRTRPISAVPVPLLMFSVCITLTTTTTIATRAGAKTLKPGDDYSKICKQIASHLPRRHLLRTPLNDTISSRAWTNYLSSLDYERAYFLDTDIESLRKYETTLDDQLKVGNMQFGFEAFELFKKRLSNRVDFVDRMLDTGFDLEKDESYNWKRDDAEWVNDKAAWDDLWRKKIKNEYIRIVVNRELDAIIAARKTNVTDVVASTNGLASPATNVDASSPAAAEQPLTNAIANTSSTNAPSASESALESPESIIRKRYRQVMTILQDSDSEWVLQKFLSACAQAYDPHSSYLPRSAVEDFEIEMKLSLVGIGALLRSEDGAAKIVRLIPGGPADRDKRDISLKPGDKIIAVGQADEPPVDVLHWPLHKIVDRIRGEKATTVVLTVVPASDPTGTTTKTVDLVRDEVKLEGQAASGRTRDFKQADESRRLGVIRLPAFYASMNQKNEDADGYRSSVKDVEDILWRMQTNNVQGVVLDLRNNGGGSLLEAINMTGLFIGRGPTVQVKERRSLRPLEYKKPVIFCDSPLVVLVNRLSASASEIVAGALQDYGRAIIVGDSKTHGKGTVQTVFDVGDSDDLGALKVTTASYYRISGASTQLKGITPDIVVSSPWDFTETGEETLRNPIPWSEETAVKYDKVMDLQKVVPELRARSKSRRSKDERYKAYEQLLDRVATLNREPVLSLNVDERRELAEAEQRLTDLQNQLATETENDAEDDDSRDLVLMEGLAILSDLVGMQEEIPRFSSSVAEDENHIPNSVVDWFRNNI